MPSVLTEYHLDGAVVITINRPERRVGIGFAGVPMIRLAAPSPRSFGRCCAGWCWATR